MIAWLVAVVFGLAVVGYFAFTEDGRSVFTAVGTGRRMAAERRSVGVSRISEAGAGASGGGLACPHCGGSQFKVSRKLSTKLAFGAASLLGQARYVVCVTCGTRYRRG